MLQNTFKVMIPIIISVVVMPSHLLGNSLQSRVPMQAGGTKATHCEFATYSVKAQTHKHFVSEHLYPWGCYAMLWSTRAHIRNTMRHIWAPYACNLGFGHILQPHVYISLCIHAHPPTFFLWLCICLGVVLYEARVFCGFIRSDKYSFDDRNQISNPLSRRKLGCE